MAVPSTHAMTEEILWIDETTGEVVEEGAEGAVAIYRDEIPTPGLRERATAAEAGHKSEHVFDDEEADTAWLPDWFLTRLLMIDAEEKALRAKFKADLRAIKARRSTHLWRWVKRFRQAVQALVAKAPTKSLNFKGGRSGWRKPRGVEVHDKKAALDWLLDHDHFDAVKTYEPDVLTSKIPKGLEVPGLKRPTEDEFFYTLTKEPKS